MTRYEANLLLYLETCAVDLGGRVASRRMNAVDFEIAERWNGEGFVEFGRIVYDHHNADGDHWVHLSERAWEASRLERRCRADRMWAKRRYLQTRRVA